MKPPESTAILLPPTPMSFRPVAGLPLIQRTALDVLRAGFPRVIALAGGDGARLRALFDRDPRTRGIAVIEHAEAATRSRPDAVLIPSDSLLVPASLNGSAASEWMQVTEASIGAAEDRLIDDIRRRSAATDGPLARFDRAVSTRLSRRLVRTPLRPNHLTLIGTGIGLGAAWCFAIGSYGAGVIAAVLFWIAVIIDGCDGEVARLTLRESAFGARLDVATDNVVHAAIFLGIGIGQYRAAPAAHPQLLSALLLGGFTAALAATWFCLLREPPPAAHAASPWRRRLLRGFELLMNRDFAYLLIVLALVDRLSWFLWGAAFGTWLYAAGLVAVARWDSISAVSLAAWRGLRTGIRSDGHRSQGVGAPLLLVAGAGLLAFLLWRLGLAAVWDNFHLVGWAFLFIVGQELLGYTANTLGWRAAFPPGVQPLGFRTLLGARIAGDAVNAVTPTATIGGEVVRVRLLRSRIDPRRAWATVTVARICQSIGQAAFVMAGLLIVTRTVPLAGRLHTGVWIGVVLFAAALAAAVVAQRRGLLTRAINIATTVGTRPSPHWAEHLRHVDLEISRCFERPQAVLRSVAWFFVGWTAGVIEIYLILDCFGLASWQRALAVETLTVAIDGLLFFIPAKMGTQEGGKVLIFSLLGLDPVKGLTLGLVRRLRELTWAAVGLGILFWHQRSQRSGPA